MRRLPRSFLCLGRERAIGGIPKGRPKTSARRGPVRARTRSAPFKKEKKHADALVLSLSLSLSNPPPRSLALSLSSLSPLSLLSLSRASLSPLLSVFVYQSISLLSSVVV